MTDYVIPCETFVRLAHVAMQLDEQTQRPFLRCVRIEYFKENLIAVSCCERLLAGEFIGHAPGEDNSSVCITIDPALLELVKLGAANSENLIITQAPGWTIARLSGGRMHAMNAEIDGSQWPDWHSLIPRELPKKNEGCFSFSGEMIYRLSKSSPSGSFYCPKYVDKNQPVIVRDIRDDTWFGLFLVSEGDYRQNHGPAEVPDWLK